MDYIELMEDALTRVNFFDGPAIFLDTFAQLPERVRHLFAVYWCDSEIGNGGFNQFFFNSAGVLAPEALQGFRELGLERQARLLERAMGIMSTSYPRDRAIRCEALEALPGETRRFQNGELFYRRVTVFDELDTLYHTHAREVTVRMEEYAVTIASGVPSAPPKDAFDIVTHFRETRGTPYERVHDFGPPWDDGSATAAICAVCQIEEMISNGAWPSVYYNRIGWMVPLAARGCRLIGLNAAAERCERAMKMVADAEAAHPDADYASDEWLTSTLMQHIDEHGWDALDDGWFELTKDTYDHAAAYITRM